MGSSPARPHAMCPSTSRLRAMSKGMSRLRFNWLEEARISATLGHRRVDRWRLGLFHLRIGFANGLRLRMPPPVKARLAPDCQEVVISEPGELAVLHDVLVHGEYECQGKPDVVFDLGANVGFATLYFKRQVPTARIVAVEADPRTYERLVRNVGGLPRCDHSQPRSHSFGRTRLLLLLAIKSRISTRPALGERPRGTGHGQYASDLDE